MYYRVADGDTIDSITKNFDIQSSNITRNNPDIPLYAGEVIRIDRERTRYHIVCPIDTLVSIANKYNISETKLIKDNNLSSNVLFIGQLIKINEDYIDLDN